MKDKKENKSKHLTLEDIKNGCVTVANGNDEEAKVCMVQEEFRNGIESVKGLENSVTFYGGTRFDENSDVYKKVHKLSYRIAKELGFAVLSGGGPGVMEASNRGAFEAGGKSIGLTIRLPHEQEGNKYLTEEIPFHFSLLDKFQCPTQQKLVFFAQGGFGTLNELFEILTLKQTEKINNVPIILYGSEYWNPIVKLFEEHLLNKFKTIPAEDLNLYTVTDDDDEVLEIVKNSKVRDGEDFLN